MGGTTSVVGTPSCKGAGEGSIVRSGESFGMGFKGGRDTSCSIGGWLTTSLSSAKVLRHTGDIFFKKRRFLSVTLRLPSVTTWYCLFGRTSDTMPVLFHLFGRFPVWFCI